MVPRINYVTLLPPNPCLKSASFLPYTFEVDCSRPELANFVGESRAGSQPRSGLIFLYTDCIEFFIRYRYLFARLYCYYKHVHIETTLGNQEEMFMTILTAALNKIPVYIILVFLQLPFLALVSVLFTALFLCSSNLYFTDNFFTTRKIELHKFRFLHWALNAIFAMFLVPFGYQFRSFIKLLPPPFRSNKIWCYDPYITVMIHGALLGTGRP